MNNIKNITNRPEYLEIIPSRLNIPENTEQILVLDNLQNSEITIAANSQITVIAILTKGWEGTKKLTFKLEGENANINFLALIIGKNKENFSLETISEHKTINTKSHKHIRSALFDYSKIIYKGNILIQPEAQQSDSYLSHNTLMLSEDTQTDTAPCLEIEANDVKAGHAATIGQIDETILFYLQSRGINREDAEKLMTKGFMQSELQKFTKGELQETLIEEITKHL